MSFCLYWVSYLDRYGGALPYNAFYQQVGIYHERTPAHIVYAQPF